METVVAVTLITVMVVGLVAGISYYTIAKSQDNQKLAEARLGLMKIETTADVLRNLALTNQNTALVAHRFSFGYFEIKDDGATIINMTVNGNPSILLAEPHRLFRYVGSYVSFNTQPFYPLNPNDTAVASSQRGTTPIYEYSDSTHSYIVVNNRVYITEIQTRGTITNVQIYVLILNAPTEMNSPPLGTVTFQAQTAVKTFAFNIQLTQSVVFGVTSGDKSQNISIPMITGSTLQVEVHQIQVNVTFLPE